MAKHLELSHEVSKLLKKQKGKSQHCGIHFKDVDVWEIDHILPSTLGAKSIDVNKQLLHRHCHDTKTANDGSMRYS
jgi:5-methylcytosine-specific restriction endonuclease McrA